VLIKSSIGRQLSNVRNSANRRPDEGGSRIDQECDEEHAVEAEAKFGSQSGHQRQPREPNSQGPDDSIKPQLDNLKRKNFADPRGRSECEGRTRKQKFAGDEKTREQTCVSAKPERERKTSQLQNHRQHEQENQLPQEPSSQSEQGAHIDDGRKCFQI